MSGECNNCIQHVRTMISSITGSQFKSDPVGAWHRNPIPKGSLACVSQKMIESITPPLIVNGTLLIEEEEEANEIVGFKTLRLFENQTEADIPKIAKFLQSHFPCTRYLINYRSDIERQAASIKSNFQGEANNTIHHLTTDISRRVDLAMRLAEQLGNQSMVLDSTKWTKDISYLNEAVTWLGFDPTCAFPRLLEMNTARFVGRDGKMYGNQYDHTLTRLSLDPRCRPLGNSR
jgi:hypothetical protein